MFASTLPVEVELSACDGDYCGPSRGLRRRERPENLRQDRLARRSHRAICLWVPVTFLLGERNVWLCCFDRSGPARDRAAGACPQPWRTGWTPQSRRLCIANDPNGARRLWLGRWGGWILLPVSTGALSAALWIGTQSTVPADGETSVAMEAWTITLAVCLLILFIAAGWAVLVTAAYLQPGGGVPLVGIEGLRRHDSSVGSYIELRRVHQRFADAVEPSTAMFLQVLLRIESTV